MVTHRALMVVLGISSFMLVPVRAADNQLVAIVFGTKVYEADLAMPGGTPNTTDPASAQRSRREQLRTRVWQAVFEDYAKRRNLEPTAAEIDSQIEGQKRMKARLDAEQVAQHAALTTELQKPDLPAARRQAAQQHLDTLNKLAEFETKRAQELRDPARQKQAQVAERHVARHWVRAWKLNQALYREFGGRIIFQQAGWEPIDAYRQLLEQSEASKSFVVTDPVWRAAVYSYFDHKFVYADETKARFYFEKPYWERSPEEIRAAGF